MFHYGIEILLQVKNHLGLGLGLHLSCVIWKTTNDICLLEFQ